MLYFSARKLRRIEAIGLHWLHPSSFVKSLADRRPINWHGKAVPQKTLTWWHWKQLPQHLYPLQGYFYFDTWFRLNLFACQLYWTGFVKLQDLQGRMRMGMSEKADKKWQHSISHISKHCLQTITTIAMIVPFSCYHDLTYTLEGIVQNNKVFLHLPECT